ncbi:hypothetical protein [Defluviitalea phaphyphila]|uniref:hypothetical protein n=1 Tax=Defluviitalea phaphyphila TaxID=1473580 RepID=UPI000730C169|nr:hypothetical protein [Defluviitalea phaphyphila]
MNWAKLKNILIFIFIILNIILGYMNYKKKVEAFTLKAEQEANIKKLLYDSNIIIYTLLPQKYPPMRKLILQPKYIDDDEERNILKVIFEDTENIRISTETTEENEEKTIYYKDNKKIEFLTGRIFYEADLTSEDILVYNKEQSKKLADKFLDDLGYNLSKLEYDFREENGSYIYYYYEKYGDNIIYNSYIEFVIKPQGIEKVNIYKMEPVRYTGLSRSIYAPDEILFGFKNQIESTQKPDEIVVIKKIDIGYLIEDNMWNKEGEGVPYYRIILGDGRYFYINAYTNEIL